MNGSDITSDHRERRPAVPHPLVECWWEQRVDTRAGADVQRVLPDACADVIVSADGQATVVGPATSAHLVRLADGERLRGLRLRTSGIGAALAGYADQAHLSRAVRALAGLTPSALLDERRGPASP